jgi:hypothetical protein
MLNDLVRTDNLRRTMNTIGFIRIDGSIVRIRDSASPAGPVPGQWRAAVGLP